MIEPRVAERRRGVSEDRARKRLKWVLISLVVVLLGAATIWLVRSPVLSVSTVETSGADRSQPETALTQLDMGPGTPTMDVNGGLIESVVLQDPWVASARVSVIWPGSIVIDVVEHVPVAPVQSGSEWYVASIDGSVLEPASVSTSSAIVAIDVGPLAPGDTVVDPLVVGALEFIAALAPDLREGAIVSQVDGGLIAIVADHTVRLGSASEMALKARVLDGLFATGLEPDAHIDLIAPSRPAVSNPQPVPEGEE